MMLCQTESAKSSGKGTAMYSKAGQRTITQYMCFSKPDVDDSKRKIRVQEESTKIDKEVRINAIESSWYIATDPNLLEEEKAGLDIYLRKKGSDFEPALRKRGLSASFSSVDRYNTPLAKALKSKHVPPTGHYNPTFQVVDKPVKGFQFNYNTPHKARASQLRYSPTCDRGSCSYGWVRKVKSAVKSGNKNELRKFQVSCSYLSPVKMFDSPPPKIPGHQASVSVIHSTRGAVKHILSAEMSNNLQQTPIRKSETSTNPKIKNRRSNTCAVQTPRRKRPRPSTATPSSRPQHSSLLSVELGYHDPKSPYKYSAEKPGNHLKSAINFTLQKCRQPLTDPRNAPHDNRFSYMYEEPKNLGHYRNIKSPSFKKAMPRDNILVRRKDLFMQDYAPNSEYTKESLSRGNMYFSKQSERPSPDTKKPFHVPECYPTEHVSKGIHLIGHIKRIQSPALDKMLPRDNKMYNINEGNNLKEMDKITRLLERAHSMNPNSQIMDSINVMLTPQQKAFISRPGSMGSMNRPGTAVTTTRNKMKRIESNQSIS